MSFIAWLKGRFSARESSLSLYRRGMDKASAHDYQGAIADYTAVMRASDISTDVKAMAIYNRSLAYAALHEDAKSAADLAALLKMPNLPAKIKAAAQQRRERVRRRNESEDSLEPDPG